MVASGAQAIGQARYQPHVTRNGLETTVAGQRRTLTGLRWAHDVFCCEFDSVVRTP